MKRVKGPWVVEETLKTYKTPWLELCEDQVIRPDGRKGSFAIVKLKPGVSVLAVDDARNCYLTSEYRYAIERESIEVVSGGIEEDEATLAAAQRELREEVGIEATQWVDLGFVDPLTSIVNSPASLFLARGLSFVNSSHESTEIIRVVKLKLSEAVRMVIESEITHGPSCVVILKTHYFLNARGAEAGE